MEDLVFGLQAMSASECKTMTPAEMAFWYERAVTHRKRTQPKG